VALDENGEPTREAIQQYQDAHKVQLSRAEDENNAAASTRGGVASGHENLKSLGEKVLSGASIDELYQHLIKNAAQNPLEAAIAGALKARGIRPEMELVDGIEDRNGRYDSSIAGQYRSGTDTISLNRNYGPTVAGVTAMHELLHAGTAEFIRKNPNHPAVKALGELLSEVRDNLTPQEREQFKLGLENSRELISYGFGYNPDNVAFRDRLKEMEVTPRAGGSPTAWNQFIRLVQRILGIDPKFTTALGELIELTGRIIESGRPGESTRLGDVQSAIGQRGPKGGRVNAETLSGNMHGMPFSKELHGNIQIPSQSTAHGNAFGGQSAMNGILADAKLFGDSNTAQAIRIHGFDSLDIKGQREVLAHVDRALHDPQILRSVIHAVPVDVMNMFSGQKLSPEDLLHDPSVLQHSLAVPQDRPIPAAVSRFIDALASKQAGTSEVGRVAGLVAERPHISPELVGLSSQRGATVGTIDDRHDITPESGVVQGAAPAQTGAAPPSIAKEESGRPGQAGTDDVLNSVHRLPPIPHDFYRKAMEWYTKGGDPSDYLSLGRLLKGIVLTNAQEDSMLRDFTRQDRDMMGLGVGRKERADAKLSAAWLSRHVLVPDYEEKIEALAGSLEEQGTRPIEARLEAEARLRSYHNGHIRPEKTLKESLRDLTQMLTERQREDLVRQYHETASAPVVDLAKARELRAKKNDDDVSFLRMPGASVTARAYQKAKDALTGGLDPKIEQRDIFRGDFRGALAKVARADGTTQAALDGFRDYTQKQPAADRWKAMDEFQTGGVGQVTDPKLRPFYAAWGQAADARGERIEELKGMDPGELRHIDNYFSQMWKDPAKAAEFYAGYFAKRPLEGSKFFMKKRVLDSYKAGMAAGLEPLSDNPVDIAQLALHQMDKFIAMHEMRQALEARGWVKTLRGAERMPEGYAEVNDSSFRKDVPITVKDENGEEKPAIMRYRYVVPELIGRDINHYLTPGLYQFKAWKDFRYAQNLLLSARLGFSAFHAGFTTVDTAVSHLDIAMRKALTGDIGGAVKMLGKSIASPILSPLEGRKLLRQFYGQEATDPHTAAVLSALEAGGARGRMDVTDWNNSYAKLRDAIRAGDWKNTALQFIPGVIEGVMRPIMHSLVPWQKMAARTLLAKYELDRVAEQLGKQQGDYRGITEALNPDALKQIMGKVVQQVDDRLGQMAYDNLFWPRLVKDIAQASIQSVGWNVGTANVVLGGIKDIKKLWNPEQLLAPLDKAGTLRGAMPRLTGRLSYLIALNLGIGALGAMTQYLLTGEPPDDLRDMFFPRTGRKNPDGTEERISFPSYAKDQIALGVHPIDTITHKLHPSFSMVADLLQNRDFYSTQIRNPDDPWETQWAQVAKYVGGAILPYAVQNVKQSAKAGTSAGMTVAPFFGITRAPGSISKSPFMQYLSDQASLGVGTRTQEQAEHSDRKSQAIAAIRRGEEPDFSGLSPSDARDIRKRAGQDPIGLRFQKLSLAQKLRAFDLASPEERQEYQLKPRLFRSNLAHAMQGQPTIEARQQLMQRLREVRAQP
jgi:hypothetical protein